MGSMNRVMRQHPRRKIMAKKSLEAIDKDRAEALAQWKEEHMGSSAGFSYAYDVKIDYKEHPEACWNYGEDL